MGNHAENSDTGAKTMQIRQLLHQIIEKAYEGKNPDAIQRYQKFFLEISDKKVRTYNGKYQEGKRAITIMGLHRPKEYLILVGIHQLSHHIDYCHQNEMNHQNSFYQIYRKLIKAALEMELVTTKEIRLVCDSADLEQISKILRSRES